MKTGMIFSGIVLSLCLSACGTLKQQTVSSSGPSKAPAWKITPGNPTYYINSVATCGDGSKVVAGTFFHSYGDSPEDPRRIPIKTDASSTGIFGTYCYNQAGTLLWKDEFTGWQGVYWVDVSASGGYAASGGWYSQSPYAGFVRGYNAVTGATILNYATSNRVNQVVLSADGTWLISGAETLVLFQLVNGTYQKSDEFTPAAGADNTIETAALSSDGSRIVCGDYLGNLYVLGNAAGTLSQLAKWSLPTPSSYSHSVRITPNGASFAAGGAKGNVYLFDVSTLISTGQPSVTYQMANQGSVYGVAIADDASAFVGISNLTPGSNVGGLVCYIQRSGSQGTLKWQYQTARNPNCASLNFANSLLAVSDGHPDGTPGDFYLLNATTGALNWQYQTGNMSWPIVISPNGGAIVGGSDDSNVYYFTP